MITDEGKACLCDFGLSSLALEFHDTTFCTSTMGGNARWAAPEIYRITVDDVVQSATPQSDVYSLGCIMLEVRQLRCHSHRKRVLMVLIMDVRFCLAKYLIIIFPVKGKFCWNFRMATSLVGRKRDT